MPIYEYRCWSCGEKFEEFVSNCAGTDEVKCPKCGKPKPDKILSAFSTGGGKAESTGGSCGSTGSSGRGFS